RQTSILLAAGVLFGIEISFWAAALNFTTITNATLLVNLTPVFAAGLGWLLLRERLSGPLLAGAATALAGAVMLALGRAHTAAGPGASADAGWIGDALAVTGAAGYASYLLIVRALGKNVSVGPVMFWATLSASIISLGLSLLLHEQMFPHSAT